MAAVSAKQTLEPLSLANDRPGELGHLFDQTGERAMWIQSATRPSSALMDAWAQRRYWRGWAGWGVNLEKWHQPELPEGDDLQIPMGLGHDVLVWFRTISPSRVWSPNKK